MRSLSVECRPLGGGVIGETAEEAGLGIRG